MNVSVIGHNLYKLSPKTRPFVVQKITEAIVDIAPDLLILGMERGIDFWAAEKAIFLGIPFVGVLPFKGFENGWFDFEKANLDTLLKKAEYVHNLDGLTGGRTRYTTRNKWMILKSDALIAVYQGMDTEVEEAILEAKKRKVRVYYINPMDGVK